MKKSRRRRQPWRSEHSVRTCGSAALGRASARSAAFPPEPRCTPTRGSHRTKLAKRARRWSSRCLLARANRETSLADQARHLGPSRLVDLLAVLAGHQVGKGDKSRLTAQLSVCELVQQVEELAELSE